MDAVEREAQVRRFVDEVWNSRNDAAAADLYGDDYANALGRGPSARGEVVRRYHRAFGDLHPGRRRAGRGRGHRRAPAHLRGTDTGGYARRPPTGRRIEEWGVTIMHVEDDRVAREWVGADKLGLFIQLKVVENPWPR